jgi:hypothetical protein
MGAKPAALLSRYHMALEPDWPNQKVTSDIKSLLYESLSKACAYQMRP